MLATLDPATGPVRATGGFARSALWRAILAAAIDRPVGFASSAEGSGFGAALLGMTALGIADSLDAAADLVRITHTEDPDRAAAAAYARVLPRSPPRRMPSHRSCSLCPMRVDRREIAAIFAGGFAGAVLRALIEDSIPHDPDTWPWATFACNIAGAMLLGWLVTRLQERLPLSTYRRPLLGTGFCGALTTFSTMQVELLDMLDAGNTGLALGYAAASIVVGFAAVTLVTNVVRAR